MATQNEEYRQALEQALEQMGEALDFLDLACCSLYAYQTAGEWAEVETLRKALELLNAKMQIKVSAG